MRKNGFITIIVLFCIALTSCSQNATETAPSYQLFEIPGVVEYQQEVSKGDVDIRDYLPSIDTILVYKYEGTEMMTATVYNCYYPDQPERVSYMVDEGTGEQIITNIGICTYESDIDEYGWWIEEGTNAIGVEIWNIFMCSPARQVTDKNTGNTTIWSPEFLFTVTTSAGKFEDCIVVVDCDDEGQSVSYSCYAKGIGKILSAYLPEGSEWSAGAWAVMYTLLDCQADTQPIEPDKPDIQEQDFQEPTLDFYEGQRFGSYGEDTREIIMTVTEIVTNYLNETVYYYTYRGEVSTGETFEISTTRDDTTFEIDIDGVIYQMDYNAPYFEITPMGQETYFSGSYVGYPDVEQVIYDEAN